MHSKTFVMLSPILPFYAFLLTQPAATTNNITVISRAVLLVVQSLFSIYLYIFIYLFSVIQYLYVYDL